MNNQKRRSPKDMGLKVQSRVADLDQYYYELPCIFVQKNIHTAICLHFFTSLDLAFHLLKNVLLVLVLKLVHFYSMAFKAIVTN